jgi:hypothetical protein
MGRAASSPRLSAAARPFADEPTDSVQSLLPFRQHRGEDVPDVDHVLPRLQDNIYAGRPGALGKAGGVVKERLRSADVDQQWRKPREVCVERRREGRARVGATQVGLRHLEQAVPLHYRVSIPLMFV